ncbi:MAG: hypothetical protein HYY84_12065 [Deltaproteobacteria bacterium]|nr:hypothetical protein [Deltaproteobacteria bacterium]
MKKTLAILTVISMASMSAAVYACGVRITAEERYEQLMNRAAADFEKNKNTAGGPQQCIASASFAAQMFRAPRDKRRAALELVAKCARQSAAVSTTKEAKEKFAAIAKKADDDAKKLNEAKAAIEKGSPTKSIN